MIYLAAPYSSSSLIVMQERFEAVTRKAIQIIRDGRAVFSPITHGHPMAVQGGLPRGWDYWQECDRLILSVCDELQVLTLDGWEQSAGVTAEMKLAIRYGLQIIFVTPVDDAPGSCYIDQ